ncbi:hypothetical protein SAMN05443144_103254 [Fodinibius roseus]|uniref:Lipoprotein n=1 Tax=Fodinibius roseus TaxID=1194090 RepID=A0A1M4WMF9_9BACT|nr:hypothetical protein [Fodinibius roseus]SHE82243.1 hypothetical protein SAMN05443144_103254 [Fodinibius roseus]
MPRLFLLATAAFWVIGACASTDNKEQSDTADSYPHLIELKEPNKTASQPGKVYIDSVRHITSGAHEGLLIAGNLSDGCTHLKSVNHRIEEDTLILELSAWRNTGAMCTQALVPFSYIYEKLDSVEAAAYSQAIINGKTYSF